MRSPVRTDWVTFDALERRGEQLHRETALLRKEIVRAHDRQLLNIEDTRRLVRLAGELDTKPDRSSTYRYLGVWREKYKHTRSTRPLPISTVTEMIDARDDEPQSSVTPSIDPSRPVRSRPRPPT